MDNILVSSRISKAKKEAGVSVPKEADVTTSDFINSAFDYVLEKKELPSIKSSQKKTAADFHHFLERITLSVDWGEDSKTVDHKGILREGKQADYETLQ